MTTKKGHQYFLLEEVRSPTGCVAPVLPLGKSGTAMFATVIVLDYTEVMKIVHLKVGGTA